MRARHSLRSSTVLSAAKYGRCLIGEKSLNYNQIVRWITNKEHHANELQHVVSQYFMTQRITPDAKKYGEKLEVLHKMLVYAMKCKQTTDLAHIATLRSLLEQFQGLYFEKGDK